MNVQIRALMGLTLILVVLTPCALMANLFTPAPLAEETLRLYRAAFMTWGRLLAQR